MSKIKELEKRLKEQQQEIYKLKKNDKRKSFWLFWILSKDEEKGGK